MDVLTTAPAPEEFRSTYMSTGRPVLIRGVQLQDSTFHTTTNHDVLKHTGTDVEEAILKRFGDSLVPIKKEDECMQDKYTLRQWFDNVDNIRQDHYYVKDFHAFLHPIKTKDLPSSSTIDDLELKEGKQTTYDSFELTCPEIFHDDWLNRYLLNCYGDRDYRFLYWGDCDTGTALHEDVMKSFSWSLNIQGSKQWTFHPRDAPCYQITQGAGDCIFVPAGLRHSVLNLQNSTISVNHNWFNQCNLSLVLQELLQAQQTLQAELLEYGISRETFLTSEDDDGGFDDHIQMLLRSNSGLNLIDLTECILFNMNLLTFDSTTNVSEPYKETKSSSLHFMRNNGDWFQSATKASSWVNLKEFENVLALLETEFQALSASNIAELRNALKLLIAHCKTHVDD